MKIRKYTCWMPPYTKCCTKVQLIWLCIRKVKKNFQQWLSWFWFIEDSANKSWVYRMSLVPTGCYRVQQGEMIYKGALLKNSINAPSERTSLHCVKYYMRISSRRLGNLRFSSMYLWSEHSVLRIYTNIRKNLLEHWFF